MGDKTGVSLKWLKQLAGRAAADASTQTVVNAIIKHETASEACAYLELVPEEHRGVPTTVAVHAWAANFRALVDALSQARLGQDEDVYIWLDVLACNLHDADHEERLDAASRAATAHYLAPSVVASSAGGTELDGPPLAGPPATALERYRRAIVYVASPQGDAMATAGPRGTVAVIIDPDAAVLTSPWCLYGMWLCLKTHAAAVSAAATPGGLPPRSPTAEAPPAPLLPLCGAGVDALLVQLVWENMSLLQSSPHTDDALHALILEEVASEPPLPGTRVDVLFRLGSNGSPLISASGSASERRRGTNTGGDRTRASTNTGDAADAEPDVEARVGAADAAVKATLLAALERRVQKLAAAADVAEAEAAKADSAAAPPGPAPPAPATAPEIAPADADPAATPAPTSPADAAAPSADGASASASAPVGAIATEPPGVSSIAATIPHLLALAATCDAYGCLVWAAGRPADGESQLRRAREVLQAAAEAGGGSPPPTPVPPPLAAMPPLPTLAAFATLHLGALLHLIPDASGHQAGGDEAELLLRSALELAGEDEAAASAAAGSGGGGGGAVGASCRDAFAPPLLAAQARHFLAHLIGLRSASQPGAHPHRSSGGPAYHSAGGAAPLLQSSQKKAGAAGGGSATAAPLPLLSGGASMQLPHGRAPAEVVPLLVGALPVFEARYGSEHPLTATLLSNTALALKDQGQLNEAEPLLRRALAVREACHGPSHVDTMRSLNNLAGLVEAQGNLEEAELLLRRAAELAAGSLGPHHAHTATALSNLGLALRKAGKLDEAEELFKAALEIRETLLGPIALDTAASLSDMTLLLRDQGRLAEAEPLLRRILDIRELVLGPAHPDTAASLCDLATMLAQLDRCRDAEPLLRRAVSIYTAALGVAHEETAAATRELASVLAQQGADAEAERHYRRALAVIEVSLGASHPETIITVNQLAMLLREMGQEHEEEAERLVLDATQSLTQPAPPATGTESGGSAAAESTAPPAAGDAAAASTTATGSPAPLLPRAGLATSSGGAAAAPAIPVEAQPRLRGVALLAMRGLAELLADAGRLEEAELLCCRALVLAERTLGAVHPVTLSCAEGLAAVLQDQRHGSNLSVVSNGSGMVAAATAASTAPGSPAVAPGGTAGTAPALPPPPAAAVAGTLAHAHSVLTVSPGLPTMSPEAEAAAGATMVSLEGPVPASAPRTPQTPPTPSSPGFASAPHGTVFGAGPGGPGGLKAGVPRTSPRSTPDLIPSLVSVAATGFRDPAASSNGGPMYTTVTVVTVSNTNSRATSGRAPLNAGRRSSLETGDEIPFGYSSRRANNSTLMVRGSLSKKALLAQAQIDLDDDEFDDLPRHPPPPLLLQKSNSKIGSNRRVSVEGSVKGGGNVGGGAASAGGNGEDPDSDDTSVGCCGLGGSRRRPPRVSPAR
ncbi:hypothetical protein GPECTOR_26g600 [Gonium pectorale]|uniref:Uncharacterized protein n=1 Tax=Gonium pectorale TaxID=33097 RepID=A0A150GFR5_GONPE|nr:hypothetical protein GPECTOR_26g600 [Gonium pectorale]|eukprot:KXZ48697.1 hypothetical protein GPECTOR_26g600 [Gonium pectorale]